jgi:outer membrane receptor protein involved in Fe transport
MVRFLHCFSQLGGDSVLNKKLKSVVFLAAYSCVSVAAEVNDEPKTGSQKNLDNKSAVELDEIVIKAKRRSVITPLPGLVIDKEQMTTNVQSISDKEIADSKSINITDLMNNSLQSVTINDYAGNPFQQDLNFRGFTASPQIGTPQGISVYLDGVRVNEAFGEVVNWDFIPMNAIASLDLIPGSNPLFGLNTLGGALALTTKNGFTHNQMRAELMSGSWGREQAQFSNGFNNGTLGVFVAYNHFKEDGWRTNSPSNVRQLFTSATMRSDYGELNFTALNVDTALTGNGVVPYEMYEQDRKAVFTSPDENKNNLEHYNLTGRFDINENLSISGLTYKRNVKQKAIGSDFYDDFPGLSDRRGIEVLCPDGSYPDGGAFSGSPGSGCAGKLPNGVSSFSDLKQGGDGSALQLNFLTENHQITAGITYDANDVRFKQSEMFADIGADRQLSQNPGYYGENGVPTLGLVAAQFPIVRNNLTGSSKTKSIFVSDTWSPKDDLHITFGARFNHTRVKNDLQSERGLSLYQFEDDGSGTYFDPSRERCVADVTDITDNGKYICTKGDYTYRSFNPSVGVAWEFKPSLIAYGNISRGARTPSVIELGCAIDRTQIVGSTNYQFGCAIPTSLTADPYLKQVRSTSYEAGTRGISSNIFGGENLNWNLSFFRTELTDDILFVPLGRKNRGVFDNFGATLRQGIEGSVSGVWGAHRLSLNYTWMRATFESPSTIINPNNSSNTVEGAQNNVYVRPGDELPGMPNHIVQASWNYAVNKKFDVTLNMVMHSSSYVRGNENNEHKRRNATGTFGDLYDYIGSGSIPGYAVFNLRANYKFDNGFSLFARLDNVFDREYATAGNLGRTPFTPTSGAAASDASGFNYNSDQWKNTTFIGPGAPRAAWFGISYDLDWKQRKLKMD